MTDVRKIQRSIFAICRRRGIDDAQRREMQLAHAGKSSLKEMTVSEMAGFLESLKTPGNLLPAGKWTPKMKALWTSGWHLGVIRVPGDEALASFIRSVTGLASARWASGEEYGTAVVEALKDMLSREAGVDWSPVKRDGRTHDRPAWRVAEAQLRMLRERGEDVVDRLEWLVPWNADDRDIYSAVRIMGKRLRAGQ